MKSPNAITLIDQWDEGTFEKDIITQMIVDNDPTNTDKPIFIALEDVKGESVVDSICIALSYGQALQLSNALLSMIASKE